MTVDAAKAAGLVLLAVVVQVSAIGSPLVDLPLVTLVAIALLRGSIVGACAGFWAGLLLDTATLGTMGFTALLLTLSGFWTGRYGETTARDRGHAPFTSVAVITVLTTFGALALHYLLGDTSPARLVLVDTMPREVALNLILTWPVYAVCRRLFPPAELGDRVAEVRLLG